MPGGRSEATGTLPQDRQDNVRVRNMLINKKSPHGGDIYTNQVRLDFSANTNPAGTPEAVREAVRSSADNCAAYPDPYCTELRKRIAAAEGVPENAVLCGNGASELIYAFAYSLPAEKPALIVSPAFSDYETALCAAGVRAKHYILSEYSGFRVNYPPAGSDLSRYGAVFLCSPGNPSGVTADVNVVRLLAASGVRLFLDLTFLDLTNEPDKYDIPELISAYPRVTALRAFTKSYAMAGLRLGYVLCGDESFLTEMSDKSQCWNVSVPAQAAGIAALGCRKWLRDSVIKISEERARLTEELRKLGIRVFPGEANFLLIYSETDLCGELLKRGILLRDCSDYIGLRKGFARIAVRTGEENDALISALRDIVAHAAADDDL